MVRKSRRAMAKCAAAMRGGAKAVTKEGGWGGRERKRERDSGRRLHGLYDRLRPACGLPPTQSMCRTIAGGSILGGGGDGEAPEAAAGAR